ncbi:class I SAM-dependent methyltransferase [Arthrobacter sp. CG_A4]|uniref:class I SAM-dependent methyltransferase n=1 Tax=Arthrobacter sp. CG_A4 TaxID=3071706 RepID=UPI002E0AA119|nr:SAM-dependent methyltransferase [Arthrobacter sp. CG_A4]
MTVRAPGALARSADTFRLAVRVAVLSVRIPRHPDGLWDNFWSGVSAGSLREAIIWEATREDEMDQHLERAANLLDTGLAVVDIGCGAGAISRRLAGVFPAVVGADVSPAAVAAARSATTAMPHVTFMVLDATDPEAVAALALEFGEVNVFVRGVFHVLSPRRQAALARAIQPLLGNHGRIYLVETNVSGGVLNYLRGLGATGRGIPGPLRQAIAALPKPGHFGAPQRRRVFPARGWTVLAEGATTLETAPMQVDGPGVVIPAYWAALGRRQE